MKTLPFLSALLFFAGRALCADNVIGNGDFEKGTGSWDLQCMGNAKATMKVAGIEGGKQGITVEVTEPGEKRYFVQLVQRGIHLDADKTYELKFRAKAKTSADIVVLVSCKEGSSTIREMWRMDNVALKEDWNEFTYTVTPKDPTENVYLLFSGLAKQSDEYSFADVSLTEKN